MKRHFHFARALTLLGVLFSLAACKTTGTTGGPEPGLPGKPDTITLDLPQTALSEVVRLSGETARTNLVSMRGIGQHAVPPLKTKAMSAKAFARHLAGAVDMQLHDAGDYAFLFADDRYALLLEWDLSGTLPDVYRTTRVSLAIGDGLHLYNALGLLGSSLGMTFVADQVVAESRCGELTLDDVPVSVCLEALMQSARVVPGAVQVIADDTSVLFAASGREVPKTYLQVSGEGPLPGDILAHLQRKATLVLPRATGDAGFTVYQGSTPLGELTEALAAQLGLPVYARDGAEDLPVNPCAIHGLPMQTALDLICAQWPSSLFSYQATREGIVFRPDPRLLEHTDRAE